MLANATVVFAVGGVSGQVQFVLDTPMPAIKCKQAVLIGLIDRKAGDAADDFFGGFRPFGAGAVYHEDLCSEGEVDPAGGDGCSNDAASAEPSVGFFSRAMG